jgi:hypothetical protein
MVSYCRITIQYQFQPCLVAFGERIPPKVTHISQIHQTACALNLSLPSLSPKRDRMIQAGPGHQRLSRETADLLGKLDAPGRAGISENDF